MRHSHTAKAADDLFDSIGLKSQNLDVSELRALIDRLEDLFVEKIEQKKAYFEKELMELSNLNVGRRARGPNSDRSFDGRARVQPKYRSRKDPNLTWSGRGSIPKWMLTEMKESRLKKEGFRISD